MGSTAQGKAGGEVVSVAGLAFLVVGKIGRLFARG
jgi:hypothetical protein